MYHLVNVTLIECLLYAGQTGTQLLGKLSWSVSWLPLCAHKTPDRVLGALL